MKTGKSISPSNVFFVYFHFHFFFLLLFSGVCLGQNATNNISEKEIKTCGLYYWGQSMDFNLEQGKLDARDDLMQTISHDIPGSQKLNSHSDILIKEINYFIKELGSKYKAVAYVKKSCVYNIIDPNKQHEVLEMKYTEKDSVNKENETKPEVNTQPTKEEKKDPESNKFQLPPILLNAITYKNINDLYPFLKSEKMKGTLVYSFNQKSFDSSPEKVYTIIFDVDTGEVYAIVDNKSNPQINIISNSAYNVSGLKSRKINNLWIMLL